MKPPSLRHGTYTLCNNTHCDKIATEWLWEQQQQLIVRHYKSNVLKQPAAAGTVRHARGTVYSIPQYSIPLSSMPGSYTNMKNNYCCIISHYDIIRWSRPKAVLGYRSVTEVVPCLYFCVKVVSGAQGTAGVTVAEQLIVCNYVALE